jgi:superfamily II DNA or RNA helicase
MDSREALISMGDMLDGTDEVREQNDIGFNKADKSSWQHVRGDTRAMAFLLRKYEKQLQARGMTEEWKSVAWTDLLSNEGEARAARDACVKEGQERREAARKAEAAQKAAQEKGPHVLLILEAGRLCTKLNPTNRCSREAFNAFMAAVRALGSRCDASKGFLWTLPAHADAAALRQQLKAAGLTVAPTPEGYVAAEAPKAGERAPDVVLKLNDAEEVEVYHPYCGRMNAAYKSSEETSGIIGFDWTKKCRVVGAGETGDLREVLDAIARIRPEWTIKAEFDLEGHVARVEAQKAERRQVTPEMARLVRPEFQIKPYQAEGYRHYVETDGRALNGDDMGLGKTFQTLLYGANHGRRTLVISPKNVRRQWLQEADKFFIPGTFQGLEIDSSMKPAELDFGGVNLVTINYEILGKFLERLKAEAESGGLDLLVLDESHRIKNEDAQVTQNVQELSIPFRHVIELSGTPIKNKKSEIYTQACILHPGVFSSRSELDGMTFYQARQRIKLFFFRRTKKAELADLPEKTRQVIPVDGKKLPDYGRDTHVMTLKSQLAQAKVPQTLQFVRGLLADTDSKIIVYSDSDDAAEAIARELGSEAVLHTGATPHERREEAKAAFCQQDAGPRVFVATTGSAREGLNLTVADKEVFNDLPWTPANLAQAEDRAYRLGQKNAVNVYWMLAEGNQFDQRNVELMHRKMAIYKKVIDGKKVSPEEEDFLKSSMEALMGQKKREVA